MALGRFRELKALESEVKGLEDALETRKVVDRAKGTLMDRWKLSEADAFTFIRTKAMQQRVTLKQVGQQILDGQLTPDA